MTGWIKPGALARAVWTKRFGVDGKSVILGYGDLPETTEEDDLTVPSGTVVLVVSEIHEGSDHPNNRGTVTLLYDNRIWWVNVEELEEVKDE